MMTNEKMSVGRRGQDLSLYPRPSQQRVVGVAQQQGRLIILLNFGRLNLAGRGLSLFQYLSIFDLELNENYRIDSEINNGRSEFSNSNGVSQGVDSVHLHFVLWKIFFLSCREKLSHEQVAEYRVKRLLCSRVTFEAT